MVGHNQCPMLRFRTRTIKKIERTHSHILPHNILPSKLLPLKVHHILYRHRDIENPRIITLSKQIITAYNDLFLHLNKAV